MTALFVAAVTLAGSAIVCGALALLTEIVGTKDES